MSLGPGFGNASIDVEVSPVHALDKSNIVQAILASWYPGYTRWKSAELGHILVISPIRREGCPCALAEAGYSFGHEGDVHLWGQSRDDKRQSVGTLAPTHLSRPSDCDG